MLASQLLRILEAIPTDVKCQTCVSDSAAQGMIMKENRSVALFNSKDMGRESDPLAAGVERDDHPSPFEIKGTEEEFWKPNFDNHLFKAEDFQNGAFCRLDSLDDDDDADSESSDANVKDGTSDYTSPYVAASDLLETDKNVVEYERPELIVCYKEINYHVAKDICIDEGMPANRKVLLDVSEDDYSGNPFRTSLNDDKSTGDVDEEALVSSRSEATSLDHTELPSEKYSCNDVSIGDNLEEPVQKDGTNSGAEEESFVDNTLPIQEFGTRSFLRSFLNTLDGEESEEHQFSGEIVSEEPTAMPQEHVPKSNLVYNSEVATRSITFNFSSLAPIKEQSHHFVAEKSLDSREMADHNEGASLRRFDRGEVSFSADSFVSHSGPIPFSGSSLCSEGSAASGRSFAFPELQSEWNSSPVRMTAADRRRFRRHNGWKSGVLCCRF